MVTIVVEDIYFEYYHCDWGVRYFLIRFDQRESEKYRDVILSGQYFSNFIIRKELLITLKSRGESFPDMDDVRASVLSCTRQADKHMGV